MHLAASSPRWAAAWWLAVLLPCSPGLTDSCAHAQAARRAAIKKRMAHARAARGKGRGTRAQQENYKPVAVTAGGIIKSNIKRAKTAARATLGAHAAAANTLGGGTCGASPALPCVMPRSH